MGLSQKKEVLFLKPDLKYKMFSCVEKSYYQYKQKSLFRILLNLLFDDRIANEIDISN